VIAGIALVSALALRGRAPAGPEPLQLAARLDPEMPAGWTDTQPWETERGGRNAVERDARAVQAGAMLVRLAMTVRERDSVQTEVLANQMLARFDAGAGDDTPLHQIAERAGAPPDSLHGLLEQATKRLDRLGRAHVRLGAWVEAARIAARERNQEFFEARDSQAALDNAKRLTTGDEAARDALAQVRTALATEGPPEWGALEAGLKALLKEIAS
jgi:hypothetical protein